jgi:hypothetical protein
MAENVTPYLPYLHVEKARVALLQAARCKHRRWEVIRGIQNRKYTIGLQGCKIADNIITMWLVEKPRETY